LIADPQSHLSEQAVDPHFVDEATKPVAGAEPRERFVSESRWFNTDAFEPSLPFTLGTSSRNPVRGPGYRNLDLAVMRRVPLSASRTLEIRAEVFNVTNTTRFGAPNTIVGSSAFGTITSAGDPRVLQLALRFLF
jgi:hypothetical protein